MTLTTKIHNDLLAKAKALRLRRLYYNSNTHELSEGETSDVLPLKMWECGPISAAWDDSRNMLENSPKNMVQWTWKMRAGYSGYVDTLPFVQDFEAPTYFPPDPVNGYPGYRVEIVECEFEEPPRSGASTGTAVDCTLNIVLMRK